MHFFVWPYRLMEHCLIITVLAKECSRSYWCILINVNLAHYVTICVGGGPTFFMLAWQKQFENHCFRRCTPLKMHFHFTIIVPSEIKQCVSATSFWRFFGKWGRWKRSRQRFRNTQLFSVDRDYIFLEMNERKHTAVVSFSVQRRGAAYAVAVNHKVNIRM